MQTLREQILAADDTPREPVKVPEWGVTVWVKTMSAAERDAFESHVQQSQGEDGQSVRALLAAHTVVDEQGGRVFSDEDVAGLAKKSGAALTRILAKAQRLNRLTKRDADELVGNFEGGPSAASPSASA